MPDKGKKRNLGYWAIRLTELVLVLSGLCLSLYAAVDLVQDRDFFQKNIDIALPWDSNGRFVQQFLLTEDKSFWLQQYFVLYNTPSGEAPASDFDAKVSLRKYLDKTHYKSRALRRFENTTVFGPSNDFLADERVAQMGQGSVYDDYEQEIDFEVLYERWFAAYSAAESADREASAGIGTADVDLLNRGKAGSSFVMTSIFAKPEIPPIYYVLLTSVVIDSVSFFFIFCTLFLHYAAANCGGQWKVFKEKFGYRLFYVDWISWILGVSFVLSVIFMAVSSVEGDKAHLFSKNMAHYGYARLVDLNDSVAPNFSSDLNDFEDDSAEESELKAFVRAHSFAWSFAEGSPALADTAKFEVLQNEALRKLWLKPDVEAALKTMLVVPTDSEVTRGEAFRWRFSPVCFSTLTSYGKQKKTSLGLTEGDDIPEDCDGDATRGTLVFNARIGSHVISACSESLRAIYLYMSFLLAEEASKLARDVNEDFTHPFRRELAKPCFFCVMDRCWGHTGLGRLAKTTSIVRTHALRVFGSVSDNNQDAYICGNQPDLTMPLNGFCGDKTFEWLSSDLFDSSGDNIAWVTNRIAPVSDRFCGLPLFTNGMGCSTLGIGSAADEIREVRQSGHGNLGRRYYLDISQAAFAAVKDSLAFSSSDLEKIDKIILNVPTIVTFKGAYEFHEQTQDRLWVNLTTSESSVILPWEEAQYPDDFVGINTTLLREMSPEWVKRPDVSKILTMAMRESISASWPFLRAVVKEPTVAESQGLLLMPSGVPMRVCGNELSLFGSVKNGIFIDVLVTVIDPVALLLVHYIGPQMALTNSAKQSLSSLGVLIRPSHGIIDGINTGAMKGLLTGVFCGLLVLVFDSTSAIVPGRYFAERASPVVFLIVIATCCFIGAFFGLIEGAANRGDRPRGVDACGCTTKMLTILMLSGSFFCLLAALSAASLWDANHPFVPVEVMERRSVQVEAEREESNKVLKNFDVEPRMYTANNASDYLRDPPLYEGRVVCEMAAVLGLYSPTLAQFRHSEVCSLRGGIRIAPYSGFSDLNVPVIKNDATGEFLIDVQKSKPYWDRPTNPDFPFVIDRLVDRLFVQPVSGARDVQWLMSDSSSRVLELRTGQPFSKMMIARTRDAPSNVEDIVKFHKFFNVSEINVELHSYFEEDVACKLNRNADTNEASGQLRISCPVMGRDLSSAAAFRSTMLLMLTFDNPVRGFTFEMLAGTFFTPVACPIEFDFVAGVKACPVSFPEPKYYQVWQNLTLSVPVGTALAVSGATFAILALLLLTCTLFLGYGCLCSLERPWWVRFMMGIHREKTARSEHGVELRSSVRRRSNQNDSGLFANRATSSAGSRRRVISKRATMLNSGGSSVAGERSRARSLRSSRLHGSAIKTIRKSNQVPESSHGSHAHKLSRSRDLIPDDPTVNPVRSFPLASTHQSLSSQYSQNANTQHYRQINNLQQYRQIPIPQRPLTNHYGGLPGR